MPSPPLRVVDDGRRAGGDGHKRVAVRLDDGQDVARGQPGDVDALRAFQLRPVGGGQLRASGHGLRRRARRIQIDRGRIASAAENGDVSAGRSARNGGHGQRAKRVRRRRVDEDTSGAGVEREDVVVIALVINVLALRLRGGRAHHSDVVDDGRDDGLGVVHQEVDGRAAVGNPALREVERGLHDVGRNLLEDHAVELADVAVDVADASASVDKTRDASGLLEQLVRGGRDLHADAVAVDAIVGHVGEILVPLREDVLGGQRGRVDAARLVGKARKTRRGIGVHLGDFLLFVKRAGDVGDGRDVASFGDVHGVDDGVPLTIHAHREHLPLVVPAAGELTRDMVAVNGTRAGNRHGRNGNGFAVDGAVTVAVRRTPQIGEVGKIGIDVCQFARVLRRVVHVGLHKSHIAFAPFLLFFVRFAPRCTIAPRGGEAAVGIALRHAAFGLRAERRCAALRLRVIVGKVFRVFFAHFFHLLRNGLRAIRTVNRRIHRVEELVLHAAIVFAAARGLFAFESLELRLKVKILLRLFGIGRLYCGKCCIGRRFGFGFGHIAFGEVLPVEGENLVFLFPRRQLRVVENGFNRIACKSCHVLRLLVFRRVRRWRRDFCVLRPLGDMQKAATRTAFASVDMSTHQSRSSIARASL
nr:MAG TPA: hypothetical protein [Caudoviricetes sp.]